MSGGKVMISLGRRFIDRARLDWASAFSHLRFIQPFHLNLSCSSQHIIFRLKRASMQGNILLSHQPSFCQLINSLARSWGAFGAPSIRDHRNATTGLDPRLM